MSQGMGQASCNSTLARQPPCHSTWAFRLNIFTLRRLGYKDMVMQVI